MSAKRSDSLYKYTRLEFVNSTINNGIYASALQSLNDPYESWDLENHDDYRVVCMTRSRNKKLMWSHYADGHRGCSIKIAVPTNYESDESPLKRVTYTSKYCPREQMDKEKLAESLYIKDKKWAYELEVRAVYCKSDEPSDYWKRYRSNIFFKAEITQIDFGCFSQFDSHYLDALIAIRDYNANHKKKIRVRKYKMSNEKYEFKIDHGFDYIKEIAKITNGEI